MKKKADRLTNRVVSIPKLEEADIQVVGLMTFQRNVLIFKNTAYQVSNICSIWVEDHGLIIERRFPHRIFLTFFVGSLVGVLGLMVQMSPGRRSGVLVSGAELIAIAVTVLLAASVFLVRHYRSPRETEFSKFLIGIELSSGRKTFFSSPDMVFAQKVAHYLVKAIANEGVGHQELAINFDQRMITHDRRVINIGSAEGATVVGGDVTNSLVESFHDG